LHITTAFNWGTEDIFNQKEWEFVEDLQVKIFNRALIYVEDYIITTYCYPVDVETENTFPHVTLLLNGKTVAKESHFVLELLNKQPGFSKFKESLKTLWKEGSISEKDIIEKGEILIKELPYNAFIYFPAKPFIIDGVTHKFL